MDNATRYFKQTTAKRLKLSDKSFIVLFLSFYKLFAKMVDFEKFATFDFLSCGLKIHHL